MLWQIQIVKLGGPRLIQEGKSVYLLCTVLNMQEMSTDFWIQRQVELSTVEMLSGLVKHGQNFTRGNG